MPPVLYNNPEECCGCRVCANVCPKDAISFRGDRYGFLYPTIDESKCIGCNLCVKSCDFSKKDKVGHYPLEGYAAKHKENAILGKQIKHLAVFNLLKENRRIREIVTYMKGKPWYELRDMMIEIDIWEEREEF